MITITQIVELVNYIKIAFPAGCEGIACTDCPLLEFRDGNESIESEICELLSDLEFRFDD